MVSIATLACKKEDTRRRENKGICIKGLRELKSAHSKVWHLIALCKSARKPKKKTVFLSLTYKRKKKERANEEQPRTWLSHTKLHSG